MTRTPGKRESDGSLSPGYNVPNLTIEEMLDEISNLNL